MCDETVELEVKVGACRTIDELNGVAYSDMTEEEIELVVEFKSQAQATSAVYAGMLQSQADALDAMVSSAEQTAAVQQAAMDAATAKIAEYTESVKAAMDESAKYTAAKRELVDAELAAAKAVTPNE